jgi:hypothetical protein
VEPSYPKKLHGFLSNRPELPVVGPSYPKKLHGCEGKDSHHAYHAWLDLGDVGACTGAEDKTALSNSDGNSLSNEYRPLYRICSANSSFSRNAYGNDSFSF